MVQDCYQDNYEGAPADGSAWITIDCSHHVVRGGSWLSSARDVRSAIRDGFTPDYRLKYLGFRVGGRLFLESLPLFNLLGPRRHGVFIVHIDRQPAHKVSEYSGARSI